METRQKVLLYGDTLVLAGLLASLKACHGLEVIALRGPVTEAELLAAAPSVVIFDLEAIQSEFLLAQVQARPGLLLIGIDPESHEVLLTGRDAGSITLDQIVQIVRGRKTD
jgi:hypothetical protein